MVRFIALLLAILMGIGCVLVLGFGAQMFGNAMHYASEKLDEYTLYENLRKVEDTCRAMMASYEADKLTWEMYKDSEIAEQREWAMQACIRANKTASEYNNYMLKNSFQWRDTIPMDIREKLEVLK